MYLVRDTFKCKPGKAKELVNKFKQTIPFMEEQNLKNTKILTDVVSNYWTAADIRDRIKLLEERRIRLG